MPPLEPNCQANWLTNQIAVLLGTIKATWLLNQWAYKIPVNKTTCCRSVTQCWRSTCSRFQIVSSIWLIPSKIIFHPVAQILPKLSARNRHQTNRVPLWVTNRPYHTRPVTKNMTRLLCYMNFILMYRYLHQRRSRVGANKATGTDLIKQEKLINTPL